MRRLVEELILLPIRTVLFTMGMMAETLKGWQHLGESSLSEVDPTKPQELVSPPSRLLQELAPPPEEPEDRSAPGTGPSTLLPPPLEGALTVTPPNGVVDHSTPEAPTPEAPAPCPRPTRTRSKPLHHDRSPRTPEANGRDATTLKEERRMYVDQDLSGNQVKVVQFAIVNVVPGIADNTRIVVGPCLVAFSDDMSPEDFTAWIIAEQCPNYTPKSCECTPGDCCCGECPDTGGPYEFPCYPGESLEKCWDRKYLRVAYSVMGRFNKADINWTELQAISVAKIAENIPYLTQTRATAAPAAPKATAKKTPAK